jgi:hypothetical protein
MMMPRPTTIMLTIVLTLSGATRALASPRDDEDAKITHDEEVAARALAEQFVGRFRIANDLAPVLREMAVKDYDERLRQNFMDDMPDDLLGSHAITEASPRQVSDITTVLLNLINLSFEQYARGEKITDEDAEGGKTLEELYPPDVVKIIKGNHELEALLSNFMGIKSAEEKAAVEQRATSGASVRDESDKEEKDRQEADKALIQTSEQLSNFTADANKVVSRLRDHLATLTPKPQKETGEESVEDNTYSSPRVNITRASYYGFPPGTRLICIKVTPISDGVTFHLCLVRVDGRLQLLAVNPVLDSE